MSLLKDLKSYSTNEFLYGVCYYPEHWEDSIWEDDFRRMMELGMNVVRMGETAWNIWEPAEGCYSFDTFDKAIQLCEKYKLKVILGTPTYAPPAWLTSKYPEVLRSDFLGNVMQHGSRRHYNYTSKVYMDLSRKIVVALAEHYQNNQTVIGWQIDNELNCHMDVSFAESDHQEFREWCRKKYSSLEELNKAWGTSFWAQTYTDWNQIFLPRPTVTYHNPSHLLDFYRFTSDATIQFAKMQYEILRGYSADKFITHNGIFDNINNYQFTEQALDFMSFDSYPAFAIMLRKELPEYFRDRIFSMKLSRVRGLSSKFIVLEQQAGPGGQSGSVFNEKISDYLHQTPKPGQMSLWAWQSIAHGADGLLFFRWRTCLFGAETLWHGLNDYGNQPNRRLDEAKRLYKDITAVSPIFVNSTCESSAAIMYDYDNDCNCKIEGYIGPDEWKSEEAIFRALNERHVMADVLSHENLSYSDDLKKYPIIFYVNAHMLEHEDVKALQSYVEQGGTLVFGPRSGYKDRYNRCHMLPFPGVLRELTGIDVTDFTMTSREDNVEIIFTNMGKSVKSAIFNEILELIHPDAEVIAKYASDYYTGKPAAAMMRVGKGRVVYFGTFFTVENSELLLDSLDIQDPISSWAEVPKEIEVVTRKHDGGQVYVFLNYTNSTARVNFKVQFKNLVTGKVLAGATDFKPFEVMVSNRELG
jgi:Beta-galactosidase